MGVQTRSMDGGYDDFVRETSIIIERFKSEVSRYNRLKNVHVLYRWLLRHPQWLRMRKFRILVDTIDYKLDEFVNDGMSVRMAEHYRRSLHSFFEKV